MFLGNPLMEWLQALTASRPYHVFCSSSVSSSVHAKTFTKWDVFVDQVEEPAGGHVILDLAGLRPPSL